MYMNEYIYTCMWCIMNECGKVVKKESKGWKETSTDKKGPNVTYLLWCPQGFVLQQIQCVVVYSQNNYRPLFVGQITLTHSQFMNN